MNGMNPSVVSAPADVYYPERDGKPMAETGIHVLVITALIATLRYYYRRRKDVYVIGNIFLYYQEGHPEARRSPDVMVIKGVDATRERRSFKTWEEDEVPSVVVEVTSKETAEEDLEVKRELYERLKVREYFLFDPLHEYLERPLMGFRLIGDDYGEKYEPLPPAEDGGLVSAELGMRLVPEGTQLGLFRFRTGERVPAPPEAYELLEEAQKRASRAEEELEKHRQRAEQERRRADELAAEVARLRAQATPPEDNPGMPDC
jgi:Uma2 family endonuclease